MFLFVFFVEYTRYMLFEDFEGRTRVCYGLRMVGRIQMLLEEHLANILGTMYYVMWIIAGLGEQIHM